MKHEDTGQRCLVAHHYHGPCIKCTCGDWVPPGDWIEHIGQGGADYGINISSAETPDFTIYGNKVVMGDYPKKGK